MPIHIPSQSSKRWTGPYLGEFYGNLWRTFNVDLDRREGKVSLSRRLTTVADTLTATDTGLLPLSVIGAFKRTDADATDRWWGLVHRGRLFRSAGSDPGGAWTADTYLNTPTLAHDFDVHYSADSLADSLRNDQLFVTTDCDISVLNDLGTGVWTASWWVTTSGQTALDSNFYHPIATWGTRRLTLVGSGHRIHTINDSENVSASRLVLPFYLQADHIFTTARRAWILCSHKFGGEGAIVEWDGLSFSPNEIHSVYGVKGMTGVNWGGIPIVLNNRGVILEYTGKEFSPMIRNGQKVAFPMSEEPENIFRIEDSTFPMNPANRSPSIVPKGASVDENGLIYFNLEESRLNSYRQGGGIWCLNPLTGRLYNKYSLGQYGDSLDYGMQSVWSPGGLSISPIDSSSNNRGLLAGGQLVKSQAATRRNYIWNLAAVGGTGVSRGYFITQYIPASGVRDFWDTLWIRFKRFVTAANRIIVKGKGVRSLVTVDGEPLEYAITWTAATTFTLTSTSTSDALEVGDEVEVLNGDNAGLLAHISSFTGVNGGAQTITIDESAPTTSTNLSLARFDRWKRLGTISSSTKYEDMVNVGIAGSFIQFKVELRGPYHQMEVESLIVNNREHTK